MTASIAQHLAFGYRDRGIIGPLNLTEHVGRYNSLKLLPLRRWVRSRRVAHRDLFSNQREGAARVWRHAEGDSESGAKRGSGAARVTRHRCEGVEAVRESTG